MAAPDPRPTPEEIDERLAELRQRLANVRDVTRHSKGPSLQAQIDELEDRIAEAEGLQRFLARATK